jgi:hypothetical protein
VRVFVKAHPKSKKTRVLKKDDTHYEVWVTEAPDRGKANKAILEALSDHLGFAKSRLSILSGETSKTKVIYVQE